MDAFALNTHALNDSASIQSAPLEINVNDSITLAETTIANVAIAFSLSDAVTTSEQTTSTVSGPRISLSDTSTVTEQVVPVVCGPDLAINVFEAVAVEDAFVYFFPSDTITVIDVATAAIVTDVDPCDEFTVTESVTVRIGTTPDPDLSPPEIRKMTVATFTNSVVKSGEMNEIVMPVGAVAIQAGDLLYQSSGNAISAGSYPWDTNLATTQGTFHDVFAGVSLTTRTTTDPHTTVSVATTGECYQKCAALAAQHEIGEFVGPAANGSALDPANIAIVANSGLAIGVLSRRALAGATGMWFKLAATVGTPFQGTQTHT